jgi:drug/metabolite transporter (DMT)-like permease
MPKIDALSLMLGVLLSIVVTGCYNSAFYFFQTPDKITEFNSAFLATLLTFVLFAFYGLFFFFFLKKRK